MDKDAIRKMFTAKKKYLVRVIWNFFDGKRFPKLIVVTTTDKYDSKIDRKAVDFADTICWCLKDVKEHIKWIKQVYDYNKLEVVGL